MIKRIHFIGLAVVFLFGVGRLLSQTVYAATTVTVTGYGDLSDTNPGDGFCDTLALPGEQCSLRAAIEELNAQGPDITPHRIEFNIAIGSGHFTITVGSELPIITVPVEIDGATQPGATCPTGNTPASLLIVLDGSGAGVNASGLSFSSGSDGSLVRGLVIGNFDGAALDLYSDNNRVRCNHIGVGTDEVTSIPNGSYSVNVQGDNNFIGGEAGHGRRNVISGNNGGGIIIYGVANYITNNFVGTTADGLSALGNSSGIFLASSSLNNVVGGSSPLARNVIADHFATGVNLKGAGNIILGNLIGVGRDGITPLPNVIGITVESDGNVIGGVAAGEANLIAFNNYYGIRVASINTAVENQIRGNIMYENNGLAIDLGGDGVDTNDIGDLDSGPNEYQNYPVLHGISVTTLLLTGTLDSRANTVYFIDIYRNDSCDPSGHGEGQELVYWNSYQTGMNGRVNFSADTSFWNITPGDYLTALATDPDGNTSEFSACLLVPASPTPTPTPTSTPSSTPTASPSPSTTPSPTSTGTASPTPTATTSSSSTEQAYIPAVHK